MPCLNVTANASWDCDGQGNCYDPGTGVGQYNCLSSCQSSCRVPTWDCDGQGNSYDPGKVVGHDFASLPCMRGSMDHLMVSG